MSYNTRIIRKLLLSAFGHEDFDIFCYDYFFDLHQQFTPAMSHTQKIQRLIEYCTRYEKFDALFDYLKEENPTQYDRFIPHLKLQPPLDSATHPSAIDHQKPIKDNKPDEALTSSSASKTLSSLPNRVIFAPPPQKISLREFRRRLKRKN